MIKKYDIENTDSTYLRIWQKINLGKEILDPEFFKDNRIPDTNDGYRLKVFQYNPDTRLVYLDSDLYMVSSNEPIYNYLDSGRAVIFKGKRSYYDPDNLTIFFFNDLIVTDIEVVGFEDYRDKDSMQLKRLADSDRIKAYLIYQEDLDKIKTRLAVIREEEEKIKQSEKQEEIKGNEEEEKLESLIRQYDKMTLLEDKETIINGNFFIDKEAGIKVEFKDKVVNLFEKGELVRDRAYAGKFIEISYGDFCNKLENVYRVGKWETPIADKLKTLNKKLLNFKVYVYNKETKEETFLKEIKIENLSSDKGKPRYKINKVKMPIQKMRNAIEFIRGGRWGRHDLETIRERLINIEDNLEKIRLYSGTQLELLQGKTIDIKLNGLQIPINFNFIAENKDTWQIKLDTFSVTRDYTSVKNAFNNLCGGGLNAVSRICDTLKAGKELEDILIGRIQGYVEKRRIAEERAETLFNEFLDKNKTRVFKKEAGYIVKGKLKNYLVKMKDSENVGVWSYPANEYVCINEKTKEGQYLCRFDKLLQFCMVMLNDGNLREQIHTIH
jgi:hypothetical protein